MATSPRRPGDARHGRPGAPRMPLARLAPRDQLAAAARVAPLLRSARELAAWAVSRQRRVAAGPLSVTEQAAAAAQLDLTAAEVAAAWRITAAGALAGPGRQRSEADVLARWETALDAVLAAEDLDGIATALYTVGTPVGMDGLFEAHATAAVGQAAAGAGQARMPGADRTAVLSAALEILADLGVVELGTDESAAGLTVTLSALGVWGVHRRLRARGWHVPALGATEQDGATGLLIALASCDAEDGEAEIGAWLAARTPARAAAELIGAAGSGSPGLRGAAFAVLDRIGPEAAAEVRRALDQPVLRAHAAVWLHEHGEHAEFRPEDRTWLLVDLGAGLLEEADPADVVNELLPEVPSATQVHIVADLWRVQHPGVTGLLTALSDHHPDPAVARAARKAAFKARSPSAASGGGRS